MIDFSRINKSSKRRIKRNEREIYPHDILLDSLARRKKFFSQKRFEVSLNPKMIYLICGFFFLTIFLLLSKSFMLQTREQEVLASQAKKNYARTYYELPARGVIYDQYLKQLVFNKASFSLACYKNDLPKNTEDRLKVFAEVSGIVNLSVEKIEERIEGISIDRALIAEDLTPEETMILQSKIDDLPGFYLKETIYRNYISGSDFSHIIGFLGPPTEEELAGGRSSIDYVGKAGLEKFYEDILGGIPGRTVLEKDALGKEIAFYRLDDPEPGKSLALWLDAELQKKSREALQASLEKSGAKAGLIVAMDPTTGGVLSLVSLPSYDNNIFSQSIDPKEWEEMANNPLNPFWNRVISAAYPTGSTIKPLIAVAGIEEEVIDPDREINCDGSIQIENPWFEDMPWIFRDWTTHERTDMRKAIAVSCNVYFYTIGGGYGQIKGLGPEKMGKYLGLFGWGKRTGIDFPDEREGLIPSKKWKATYFQDEQSQIWLPGDTYNLSIGQGYVSVSPIQVVVSFSAIANGGKLLEPHFVKQVLDHEGQVIENVGVKIIRQDFVSSESIDIVREGMRDAVIYGSSATLSGLPVTAGAKTGTAQTGRGDYYHNWVTVFAPYDNPEIVITVMIENVPDEQVAALPVAKEVLNWYFSQGIHEE